jgi:2-oxoglutarate dehydrogenase E1 component
MLRHPDANSPIEDFTNQRFLPVVPDSGAENAKRILVCTGKIGHELRVERERRKDTSTAVIFLDQMYPFPEAELKVAIDQHASAREVVWVQEEPANMGALFYMMPRLRHIAGERAVLSVKRSASPSPSTGSAGAHEMEQKTLISLALTGVKD